MTPEEVVATLRGLVDMESGIDMHPMWMTMQPHQQVAIKEAVRSLDHVAELEAENAALRDVARDVAAYEPAEVSIYGDSTFSHCPFCGEDTELDKEPGGAPVFQASNRDKHDAECPVTKARALTADPQG